LDLSERDRLTKRQRVLLLAASDMEQTIEAARAIQREGEQDATGQEPNVELVRALETAIAVCYWRPFTNSSIGQLDPEGDGPAEATGRELHRTLKRMRDKAYAHTDTASGRDASVKEHTTDSGISGLVFTEGWWAFPREWLPDVIALAEGQRDRFRAEASDIRQALEGPPESS
jgi:hypothetical protein